MFKKLEDDKKTVLAVEEKPETECTCTCRKESAGPDKDAPTVDQAVSALAVHFDING